MSCTFLIFTSTRINKYNNYNWLQDIPLMNVIKFNSIFIIFICTIFVKSNNIYSSSSYNHRWLFLWHIESVEGEKKIELSKIRLIGVQVIEVPLYKSYFVICNKLLSSKYVMRFCQILKRSSLLLIHVLNFSKLSRNKIINT